MQISKDTIDILKNFSEINQNLLVKEGNTLSTISVMKNILADAEVSESFPREFGLYDLNDFLAKASIHDDCEVDFDEVKVSFTGKHSKGTKGKSHYADPSVLVYPKQSISFPEAVIEFELKEKDFQWIKKASAVANLPDLVLQSDGDVIKLVVTEKQNDTSDDQELIIGDGDGKKYFMAFKAENIKILSGDYTVFIAEQKISKFVHKTKNIVYHIALEPDSTYEG